MRTLALRRVVVLALAVGACGDDAGTGQPRPADGGGRAADAGAVRDASMRMDAPTRDGGARDAPPAVVDGAGSPDARPGDAGALVMPVWDPARYAWPMFGHDPRRTGRSTFNGPSTYTAASTRNWSYVAEGAASINMQAVVTAGGAYFGGWGLLRRAPGSMPDTWVKADGRYYGLELGARADGVPGELFAPVDPHPQPVCYRYAGRTPLPRDDRWCGAGSGFIVSYYNGTIEGTALVDPDSGDHYVGRGDGALYAIDPAAGTVRWRFATFNPVDRGDSDGGGEIIGGPVMGPGKRLYFATWGAPTEASDPPLYETHAVYAVDTAGALVWRYPSATARLDGPFLAAPALSPDGHTLYVATWFADGARPGRLLALDLTAPAGAGDGQRLRWELALKNPDRPGMPSLWARHLSVGADGTIYVGAAEAKLGGSAAAILAVRDDGDAGRFAWTPAVIEPQGYPDAAGHMVQGIALWEEAGRPVRMYVATSHTKNLNATGGALLVLDATTGRTLATFDPATLPDPGIGGMTPPVLGADETVYVGIRGRHDLVLAPDAPNSLWRDGRMYALRLVGTRLEERWHRVIPGQLDWSAPAIGANGALYFGSTDRFSPLDQATFYGLTEVPDRHNPQFFAIFD